MTQFLINNYIKQYLMTRVFETIKMRYNFMITNCYDNSFSNNFVMTAYLKQLYLNNFMTVFETII